MKKIILLLFLLLPALVLQAQHLTIKDSIRAKPKRIVLTDSIKPVNVFSVGVGMELKTINGYTDVGEYSNANVSLPTNENNLIYKNSFIMTSPLAMIIDFAFTDKKFNSHKWAISINPKKVKELEITPYSQNNKLVCTYSKFQYSYARPYSKKAVYLNDFVPYYALKSSIFYSLNKYYYSAGEWGTHGYNTSDVSYVFMLSFAPTVKKTFTWLTLELSYDIALFGLSSVDHNIFSFRNSHFDPQNDYQIESSTKKKEFLDPVRLFNSHLMFNNFNISIGVMFKPYPYKRFKVKKTEK